MVARGNAVGDVIFTRIVAELNSGFMANDAAGRENNDKAALNLMKTIVLIDLADRRSSSTNRSDFRKLMFGLMGSRL
ncbi:hypothetical protein GR215_29540 [Rhizobium leguminosarum]|mgnify:CR=1 FL=1|uniref:hypothetical protein n=1 Tax=Rhizobium leguminosarum TaxID=384 RepID=UPI0003F51EA1|nr:hypothetical protein [Rhizobium leguminosarum]NEH45993.1 hypothetical protein [Rhizobium leguminosarum]